VSMDQPGSGGQTPPGQTPPSSPPPPPPQQSWQSTPQQPAPPPPAGGQPGSGMPSWTSNLTAQGTIPGPGGVALADTPNRVIAAVIDFIILGIVGFIVQTLTTSILGDNILGGIFGGNFRIPSLMSSLVAVLLMLVISGAYFIGMWTRMNGATVGMRVLKLTVRDASTGGPITQQQAISRWMLLGAPWALGFFQYGILGLIFAVGVLVWYIYLLVTVAQSPSRQGLHDTYSKTVVAKG
jgi:uncharacterized RDD family membrane protein YckC